MTQAPAPPPREEQRSLASEGHDENDSMENDLLENGEEEGSLDEVDEFQNLFLDGSASIFMGTQPPERQDNDTDSAAQPSTAPANVGKSDPNQDAAASAFRWLSPVTYMQLLMYPEGYADYQNGLTKPSFAVLREAHFVRQRRKLLTILTLYLMAIRCASWDAFLMILLLSYAFVLYYLKHAGQWNLYLAKKNWKQRVGWARQWVGSFFSKATTNHAGNGGGMNSAQDESFSPPMPSYKKKGGVASEASSSGGRGFLRRRKQKRQQQEKTGVPVDPAPADPEGALAFPPKEITVSAPPTPAEYDTPPLVPLRPSGSKTDLRSMSGPPSGFGIMEKAKGLWSHVKPGHHPTPSSSSTSSASTSSPTFPVDDALTQSLNTHSRTNSGALQISTSDRLFPNSTQPSDTVGNAIAPQ